MTPRQSAQPLLTPPLRPSMHPAWRFRPALPSDALALRENCLPHWSLEKTRHILRRAQRNALNRRGLGLVAVLGGDVVGFGQITLWSQAAEISDLVVGAPWRCRGIGSALIGRLIEAAREMAVERVEIGVALRDYHVLRLYRKLGFDYGRTLDLDLGLGHGLEPVMYMQMTLAVGASSPA